MQGRRNYSLCRCKLAPPTQGVISGVVHTHGAHGRRAHDKNEFARRLDFLGMFLPFKYHQLTAEFGHACNAHCLELVTF